MHFYNAYTAKTGSSRSNPGYRVKEQGAQTNMDNETNHHLSLMPDKVFLNVSMCDVNNTKNIRIMVTELSAVDVGNAFVVDGAAKSVKGRVPATCHARGTEEGLP